MYGQAEKHARGRQRDTKRGNTERVPEQLYRLRRASITFWPRGSPCAYCAFLPIASAGEHEAEEVRRTFTLPPSPSRVVNVSHRVEACAMAWGVEQGHCVAGGGWWHQLLVVRYIAVYMVNLVLTQRFPLLPT